MELLFPQKKMKSFVGKGKQKLDTITPFGWWGGGCSQQQRPARSSLAAAPPPPSSLVAERQQQPAPAGSSPHPTSRTG